MGLVRVVVSRCTSAWVRLRMRTAPGTGRTPSVSSQLRRPPPNPTRLGMPAHQVSSAERRELGKITAKSASIERRRRATDRNLSPVLKVCTASTAGWEIQRSWSFSGQSRVICASGKRSRRRRTAGVVITASPSQFTPRMTMCRGVMRVEFMRSDPRPGRAASDWPWGVSTVDEPRTNSPDLGARRCHIGDGSRR